nr:MAG TPA: hypothetical protein [Caudoviricetes sp.]
MLPAALRWKIIFMIDDGATFEAVANDPEIAGEYKKRGLRLTAPAMSGIKKSKEYQEVTAARRRKQLADRSSQLTTALLRDAGTLETVSDQARVKLIQALSDLSDLPENSDLSDGDRVKALRSLAQSVAALTNPAKDNQIAELKRKLREKDDEIEAAEKEHAAEIARLNFELKKRDDEIAELRKLAGTVDNEAVIQKLNESVGLT